MIAEIKLDAYESAHALGKLDSKWRKCFTHEHNIRRCFKCARKARSLTAGRNSVKQCNAHTTNITRRLSTRSLRF